MAKRSSAQKKPVPSNKQSGVSRPGSSPIQRTGSGGTGFNASGASAAEGNRQAIDHQAALRARIAERRASNQKRQRYVQRRSWWQGRATLIGAIVSVALVITLFVVIAHNQNTNTSNATPVPASVLHEVTGVSAPTFASVGTGGVQNPFYALTSPGSSASLTSSGKPEVLYIGAEYCPYCAAERWSVIVALSRFGTFSNLHYTTSSSTDVFPDTPTFTFYGSSYTSKYVTFVPVEEATRDQATPLQTPTSQQNQLIAKYDAPPYVQASAAGSIPFLDIANLYGLSGASFSPQSLAGLSQQDIASKLSNSNEPTTQGIVGTANYMTAAICKATNQQPSTVCTSAPITTIQQQLPQGK